MNTLSWDFNSALVALLVLTLTAAFLWKLSPRTGAVRGSTAPTEQTVSGGTNSGRDKKTFTRKEVGRHQTSDDCWIILDSKEHGNQPRVYNVTAYVEEHPGGQAILNNAGGNSTTGIFGQLLLHG